jgi:poly-gamma-glutamate synthesis protein (capsule biosynthesis protein)
MKKSAVAVLLATVCAIVVAVSAQSPAFTIVLSGQSMIRSDLRATKPAALPVMKGLLSGDVVLTNLEAAVAEPGETIQEGRGFLTPPEALDALTALGFNLLALSGNHAFDLKETGIRNTLRETDRRKIAHAGTGNNIAEASAPSYLQTPKGTIALVASASGLIAPGARATAERAGVNELRVLAGDRENEATDDLPGAPANTPNPEDARRILQGIRDARQRADLVIVYQHNHVFGNRSFSTILYRRNVGAARPKPVADEMDARRDRCGRRHRRDAWRAVAAWRGDLS